MGREAPKHTAKRNYVKKSIGIALGVTITIFLTNKYLRG